MTSFQKPALSDDQVVGIIEQLYGSTDTELNQIVAQASQDLAKLSEKRLRGKFADHSKPTPLPSVEELLAQTTVLLGQEFKMDRAEDRGFDPYEFMGVSKRQAAPAPVA
jgi:hypothetical protein